MSSEGWYSLDRVLDDLAKATGKRVKFDRKFVVTGQQSPPAELRDENDTPVYDRFDSGEELITQPDLAGITQSIRMANEHDESTYDDYENMKQLERHANTVISISKINPSTVVSVTKLNPNVPELTAHSTSNDNNNIKHIESNAKTVALSELNQSREVPKRKMNQKVPDKSNGSTSNDNKNIKDVENNAKNVVSLSKLNPNTSAFVSKLNSNAPMCSDYSMYEDNINNKQLEKNVNDVVSVGELNPNSFLSISKLNPNVPDFIPRICSNSGSVNNDTTEQSRKSIFKENSDTKESSCKILDSKETSETNSNHQGINKNVIDVDKKINVTNLNSEEIKDIKEKLKLKIIDTSKANCLKKKRERNVAFAALLKLNAENHDQPIKLMTPEYFKTAPKKSECVSSKCHQVDGCDEVEVSLEKCTVQNGECVDKIKLKNNLMMVTIPTLDVDDKVQPTPQKINQVSSETSSSSITFLHKESTEQCGNEIVDQPEETPNIFTASKEVKESVKKVQNWLEPEKSNIKPVAVFFCPVAFKRKASASVSPKVEVSERSSSALTSDSFVPSSYADELTRSYMERSKAKELRSEDMWTKLERDLKEKDKAIKNSSA